MAFPQTANPTPSSGDNAAAHTVTMPATVNAGDLLIAIVSLALDRTFATPPTDWVLVAELQAASGSNNGGVGIFAKLANGTEDGTTVSFPGASGNVKYAAQVYRILAGTWQGTIATAVTAALVNNGTNVTTANPPNLAPAWGAEDTLWIAGFGGGGTSAAATTVSDSPDNYTNTVTTGNILGAGNDAMVATCRRELNASSEDPNTFTIDDDFDVIAFTIAIRPASGTTVEFSGAGGAIAGGAAVIEFTIELEGAGGAIAGGVADFNFQHVLLEHGAAGGAIAGGAGTFTNNFDMVGGGAAIAGGAATVQVFTAVRPGISTVTVYNQHGVLQGSLTPLNPYKISRFENQIGSWECLLPVDESIDYEGIPLARKIEYGWKIDITQENFSPENAPGSGHLLYQGMVEERTFAITEGGQTALLVKGSFRTFKLVRRSVLHNFEYDGSLKALTDNLVGTLLDPYGPVYDAAKLAGVRVKGKFNDLTKYAAWLRGAAQGRYVIRETWDHDRPELVPYYGAPDSGLTFRRLSEDEQVDPDERYAHDTGSTGVAIISGRPMVRWEGPVVNRIIAVGTDTVVDPEDPEGTVSAELTLAHASLTSPYTVKAGLNPDGTAYYYIEDEDSIERYDLTEIKLHFSEVRNPNDLSETRRLAANVLYMKAVNEMIRRRSELMVLTLQPIANGARIWALPGDSAMFEYHGEVETESGVAIWMDESKRFLITERHEESHPSGIRRVGYVLKAPVMEFPVPGLPGEIVFPPESPCETADSSDPEPSTPDCPSPTPPTPPEDDPGTGENEGPDDEWEENFPPIEAQCGRYGRTSLHTIMAGGATAFIPFNYKIDGDLDFGSPPIQLFPLPDLGEGTWSVSARISLRDDPYLPDRTWTVAIVSGGHVHDSVSFFLEGGNTNEDGGGEVGAPIATVGASFTAGGFSTVAVRLSPDGFGGVTIGWRGDDYIQLCFTPAP